MTASIPIYEPLVERVEAGESPAPRCGGSTRIGMPEDCAPLVVFLASDAGAGVTGQAIGIGGDRLSLYSHPAEVVAELRDGGWTRRGDRRCWDERRRRRRSSPTASGSRRCDLS